LKEANFRAYSHLALIPATAVATFFPWRDHPIAQAQRGPGSPPFLARQESRSWPPSISFQPFGCGSIASGLSTAIEVAVGAARENQGNETMATIGTFTTTTNGLGCVHGSVL